MTAATARLTALLQIRSTEKLLVALLVGVMFFVSAGLAVGAPGIEALFYARFGVQFLPYMYILLGVVTIVTSLGITAAAVRTRPKRRFLSLPIILAVSLMVARMIVAFDVTWFYPLLWLGMNVIGLVQGLLVWGLAGYLCDARQAKRLFPLFGAGGILGLAIGGLLTRPLVGMLGAENLMLIWAAALMVTFSFIWMLLRGLPSSGSKRSRQRASLLDELQQGSRFVRQSPLMRWMSLAAVLFAILFFSLVFPFSKGAAAAFQDEDALAGFLGLFQGLSTGVAIVLSIFVANRLYARFGFMAAILVFPIIYLLGFTGLSISGVFPALVTFRFIQIVWLEGIAYGAFQAMFNVVPPGQREQARSFVQGVANHVGVSLAGVLLAFSEQILQPQHIYLIGIVLAAATTYFVWQARRAYGPAVVEALRAGQSHLFFAEEEPFGGFQRDAGAVVAAVAGISHQDPTIRRVSAEVLGNLSVPEAIDAIVAALQDEDPSVRVTLLKAIAQTKAAPALLDVAACLNDPDGEVRQQAVATLEALAGYPQGLTEHIHPLLNDPDPSVRCRVAATLLKIGPHPKAERTLRALAGDDDIATRLEAMEMMALWGDQSAFDLAGQALDDPHPAIRRAAARVLAHIDAQQCIVPLISALADEAASVRQAVAEALGSIGRPVLEPTVAALDNPPQEAGALQALELLPVESVSQTIKAYAHDRAQLALRYHQLQGRANSIDGHDERARLLSDSLGDTALRNGIYALKASGLLGNRGAITMAIDNLQGPNPAQRANALETLDTVGDVAIVRPLLSLWDSSETTTTDDPQASEGWLVEILQDPDPWLRACAALVAKNVAEVEVKDKLAHMARSDPEAFVCECAHSSLNGDGAMETLPTISQMERILFLRRVSLFTALSTTDLKQIAAITDEYSYEDGELIAEQGELGEEMYIIVSGAIRVIARLEDGATSEVALRQPGEYVGEMSIISHEERVASLIASGDVRVLCIEQGEFEEILRLRPDASLAVMRVLCDRLKESIAH